MCSSDLNLFDLCERIDKRVVNRRVIEALVRGGALDSINDHRASLLASVGMAMEAAEQKSRAANQVSLFGDAEPGGVSDLALVEQRRWDKRQLLREEKTALGFYLSGHPFGAYAEEVRQFARTPLNRIVAGAAGDFTQSTQLEIGRAHV